MVASTPTPRAASPAIRSLSERRAEAVKRFLREKYGIEASSLVTVGYGKSRLKSPTDPLADENRQVRVVNVAPDK